MDHLPKRSLQPASCNPTLTTYILPNRTNSPLLLAYRVLRTERVLKLGWRQADHLVHGLDFDRYDAPGADTVSIVMVDELGFVIGGFRCSLFGGNPLDSLSFEMWGAEPGFAIDSDLTELAVQGRMADVTRFFIRPQAQERRVAIALLGAAAAVCSGAMGSYFTTTSNLCRLMQIHGINVNVLHEADIEGTPAVFAYIPPAAWTSIATERGRRFLREGANSVSGLCAEELLLFTQGMMNESQVS